MSIRWFPGHMIGARKKAAESMRMIDLVIEVLDARVPRSRRKFRVHVETAFGYEVRRSTETGRVVAMNLRTGFLIGCLSIALTSLAASAAAGGSRSELCDKLQKSVADVTGKAFKKARAVDVKGNPLMCIYSPEEGWQGVKFELPDGDAKKLAEWRANFAKGPKTMTDLTDLPELGPGAFRANEGGAVHVHGLTKKGLLIVTGSFKADVEVQLWKRIASEL